MVQKGRGHGVDTEFKGKVDEILQEVRTAQDQDIVPQKLLTKISSFLQKDPSLAIPLIEGLTTIPTPQTAQLLHEMMSTTEEKGVNKAIRKTLYRLRQRGIIWEKRPYQERSVLHPPELGEPQGYLGAMDSTGSMVVVVARPRLLGGMRVYFSIVNDLEGIDRFERNDLTKGGFKEFIDRLLSSEEFPVVEAPGGYCLHLLKEAAGRSHRLIKSLPTGFQGAQREMQEVVWEGSVPLVYEYIEEEAVKDTARLLKESGSLHRIVPFSTWFLNPDEVRTYTEALREADESHIILTPQQKDARLSSIYMEALQELFPEEKRLLWKRRLEETAYVLWKTGQEQEARRAVSAALDLKTPFNPIEPNPFIWNLMLKSIYAQMVPYYEERQKEEEKSLIVTP